jgi:hypothetical protein
MFVQNAERNRDYLFKVQRFVRFLATIGVIPGTAAAGERRRCQIHRIKKLSRSRPGAVRASQQPNFRLGSCAATGSDFVANGILPAITAPKAPVYSREGSMQQYLPPLDSLETERATDLLRRLSAWAAQDSQRYAPDEAYHAAIAAVHRALRETRTYLRHRNDGGERDAATEAKLSNLWSSAAQAIGPHSQELGNLCYVKGHGWADDSVWGQEPFRSLPIGVDEMLSRLLNVAPRAPRAESPRWFPIAGVAFAAATVISLFYLLIGPTPIEPGRRIIFNVWVALCVAASGAFLGGTAFAHGQLPIPNWLGGTPAQFMTRGGIAVFIVTFLVLSAAHH